MKKVILKLIILVGILGFSVPANAVPVQWATNGHWYEIQTSMTWNNAEANAQSSYGGHLVTINDAAEQSWLTAQFGIQEKFWIGFNDAAIEGTWVWSSGEAITYTNWHTGEPNNGIVPGANEDYALINAFSGLNDWNDAPGNLKFMSIVEFTVSNNVPEPAALGLLGLGLIGLGLVRRRKSV
ncbi:MAG: lectin [Alphaproteobacteria bacterium]|nr:MAG: lectin [Alphaproteobacteria bacterium]